MSDSHRPSADSEAVDAKDSLRCRRVEDALYRRACGYKVRLKKSFKVKRVDYDSDTGKKISEREDLEAGFEEIQGKNDGSAFADPRNLPPL